MSIDICSDFYGCMAHELLGYAKVNACLLQIRAVGVAEVIGNEVLCKGIGRYESVTIHPAAHGYIHLAIECLPEPLVGAL